MNRSVSTLFYILTIFTLASLYSCKSPTGVVRKKLPEKSEASGLIEQLAHKQVNVDWLTARLKLNYEDEYQTVSAKGTIKMRKDSIIWMNIKKLEYEAARILITTDSVYIIDRLNKQFYIKDLNYLQQTYNLPASLASIQAIILGNPVFINPSILKLEKEELSYHLFGKDDRMESHYRIDMAGLLLSSMAIDDFRSGSMFNYDLDEYGQIPDNQNFSYIRKLEMNSRDIGRLSVGIKFSKVEVNIPKPIRFEIPERYSRID